MLILVVFMESQTTLLQNKNTNCTLSSLSVTFAVPTCKYKMLCTEQLIAKIYPVCTQFDLHI